MDIRDYMLKMGQAAKLASASIRRASTDQKNIALRAMGEQILGERKRLMLENEILVRQSRPSPLALYQQPFSSLYSQE